MIRLTRLRIGFVLLALLGALFVDGFGAGYQIYASHVSNPNLGCNDVGLRASGFTKASGTFTLSVVDGAQAGRIIAPPTDPATGSPQWGSGWAYNVSAGGGQQIAVISGHALVNQLAEMRITRPSEGYHLAVSVGPKAGDRRTFTFGCTAHIALTATPSPTTSASAGASPSVSATASPSASASASPSPSASPTAAPVASLPAGTTNGGSFWVDGSQAPVLPGIGPWGTTLHKGLDIVGGSELTIVICHGPNNPAGSTCRNGLDAIHGDYAAAQSETVPIIEQRVNSLGVAEATVTPQDNDKIIVQIPGVSLDEAEKTIGTTAKLHFATAKANVGATQFPNPNDRTFLADQDGLYDVNQLADPNFYPTGYHWLIDPKIPATDVTNASASVDTSGNPAVNITFNADGAAEWNKVTTAAVGQTGALNRVAIFLDNQVLTAPAVQSASSSNTQITGGFTTAGATQLATQINAGALPADISTIQSTSVSATLGQQSVRQTFIAGAIGLLVVILFMISYYRFPGILATLALVCYAVLVLALFKVIPVTISLAGLAGFVLSVGMAVDANVLIFERTRDELRHGHPVRLSVETGFRRAFPAIRDSNFSTLIACLILYVFGTEEIRGFALTLGVGVVVSFLSAILITQGLFMWALNRGWGRSPRLYTEIHDEYAANPPRGRFDIVKNRNWFFALSLAILIPGILAILFWGFRLGLDFAGGNRLDVHLTQTPTLAQVQNTVNSVAGDLNTKVQAESNNHFSIQTKPAPISRVQQISDTLSNTYGFVTDPVTHRPDITVDTVGPTIAASLVQNAVLLVLVSALFISVYLRWAFRGQREINPGRFAVATFFKLLHDVFVLLGIWAILGHFSDLGQVDALFVTAVLTSVAFSIHDTIVVLDRVRENLKFGPRITFDQTINLSTMQTMTRSLNTALTVVFVLLSMVLFGGATIRGFVLALLVGIVTGTYSSIFNASTLLVAWRSLDAHRDQPGPGTTPRRSAA